MTMEEVSEILSSIHQDQFDKVSKPISKISGVFGYQQDDGVTFDNAIIKERQRTIF